MSLIRWMNMATIEPQASWHGPRKIDSGSLLPIKVNRSRGRGAKPQVRSQWLSDGWATEEGACPAPEEQAFRNGEGQLHVHIAA